MKFKIFDRAFLFLLAIIILAAVLRFYKLGSNPPGLYWDEAVFGYDAYSLLKTGRDHHGDFLPLFFESFGDWKLPVYHYLLIPSIAVFGLNEFAVRFPSALLGTFTVLLTYFLTKKLFTDQITNTDGSRGRVSRQRAVPDMDHGSNMEQSLRTSTDGKETIDRTRIAILAALILAISPWHIQFSRGGFESTAGLFFVVSGIYFFLLVIDDRKINPQSFFLPAKALAAAGLLTFSMYTYHAYRIFTPLLMISLIFIFFAEIKKSISKLILPALLSLILILPILLFTISPQGRARAISQSTFKKADFETARIDYDQKSKKPLRFLSKYWYSPTLFSYMAFNNYIDHFSPIFLFFKGDQIGRHSQVDMGQIYLFEMVLLAVSIFAFKNLKTKSTKLMLAWLLISPIPAMIVTPTPHAYRTLQMAIPLAFFSGLGAYFIFSQRFKLPLKFLMAIVIFYYFLTYLHLLFVHYPAKFSADWQDGYREMVAQIQRYQNDYDKVYVTNINQVPYIYLLFYQKYDPTKFIAQSGTREAFDKYVFVTSPIKEEIQARSLYVAPSWEKVDGKWLSAVNDTSERHIYSLWEVGNEK